MSKKNRYDRIILISSSTISRGVYESHVVSFLESLRSKSDVKLTLISFGQDNPNQEEKKTLDARLKKVEGITGYGNIFIVPNIK